MRQDSNEETNVSAAVRAHLLKHPFWTDSACDALIHDVGEVGGRLIREAYDFACNQEDLWLNRSYAEAALEVQSRLAQRHPDWDARAIEIIANMAAFSWR